MTISTTSALLRTLANSPYLAAMGRSVISAVACLGCALSACDSRPSERTLYVTTTAQPILPALNKILNDAGLVITNGSATNDTGNVLRVVEAKNNLVTVWAQMMPMSGYENSQQCGEHSEPYNDPGQYMIEFRSRTMFTDSATILGLAKSTQEKFTRLGYVIANKPSICSVMAKTAR